MKKHFKTIYLLTIPVLLLLAASCKKTKTAGGLPPKITGVTNLTDRNNQLPATDYGTWIMIKGQHLAGTESVVFNTIAAADSLIWADDTSVTVKIPAILPHPSENPITVTTPFGSDTYQYTILQPAPVIYSFNPVGGVADDEVTIKGDYFGGVSEVRFDNTPAQILSSTKSEITVKVPAGVQLGYIYVTTASGTVKSGLIFGYAYMVFDEAVAATWYNSSFGGTFVLDNATPVRSGSNSVKCTWNGWGAFRISKNAPTLSTAGYTGIKFSIYVGQNSIGKKVKLSASGNEAAGYTIIINEADKWLDFQVPFTNLGNPATLTNIIIKEFSGQAREVYLDDIGLY
ncbi:IPT/TIG domain-containing protein [Pseudoflavitalea rhizosphaerae]|uniref:IPT/TIG domain-containing protein n=1 Tax=Pseudoflavitalea rhizosphaerae TaxID=1884793 RepID=UPI000F8F0D51|nr:IPT/TIG domain-containing protein [Pseudoflavitalea rhizosphaerae]